MCNGGMPTGVIRLGGCPRMPWKNGQGETTQLCICPRGAELARNDYLFRVSSAVVRQSGPFSTFDGYSRWLWLTSIERSKTCDRATADADVAALTVVVGDGQAHELRDAGDGFSFDGGVPAQCFLAPGCDAIRDFGIIFKRDKVVVESVEVVRLPAGQTRVNPLVSAADAVTVVHVACGSVRVRSSSGFTEMLDRFDTFCGAAGLLPAAVVPGPPGTSELSASTLQITSSTDTNTEDAVLICCAIRLQS
eukprot:ANDGO_01099.mRNA.1 hypothetical protein SPRG_05530